MNVNPPVAHWTIVGCTSCGVHFPDPLPTSSELYHYYADQEEASEWEQVHYVDETADRSESWSRFAEKLTRLNGGPGALLEVGPAAGHLMKAARQQGWTVMGVEASPKFTKVLRRRGLPVHEGTLATFKTDSKFDLIVMVDVIEHLHDPIADLARVRALLRPSGIVVIATCDIGSLAARHYGLRWRQIVISHTYYWTKRSLQIALLRGGLEPMQISSIRWWDPDPRIQRREKAEEFAKLVVRKLIHLTWSPLASHSEMARRFQSSHSDLDRWLTHKVGDQAVMSEVVLLVGRLRAPRESTTQ